MRRLPIFQSIDKSWLVFVSIENFEHDRRVDFSRDRTGASDSKNSDAPLNPHRRLARTVFCFELGGFDEAVTDDTLLGHKPVGRVLVELASAPKRRNMLDIGDGVLDVGAGGMRQLDSLGDEDERWWRRK